MRIGLAQAGFPRSVADGVQRVQQFLRESRERGCDIVCFPEAYLPGMREQGFPVPDFSPAEQQETLKAIQHTAREVGVPVILPMEWQTENGVHNAAVVIDEHGAIQGWQIKNQLDPGEDHLYVPGNVRRVFTIKGVTFGIAICHEGWRYPETVRWAAVRGASIVFHPHYCGGPSGSRQPTEWGNPANPYYEKAMVCRSLENNIYFASINYALPYQESTTSLISPEGECLTWAPYGEELLLVHDIDPARATGLLARRYNSERYGEAVTPTGA
jgi:predicted amidohydrolase